MSSIRERYSPIPVAANSTTQLDGTSIGGFLCKTAGTVSVTNDKEVTVVDAFPVEAGVYYPMPFFLGNGYGKTFVTAGGASGTLAQ